MKKTSLTIKRIIAVLVSVGIMATALSGCDNSGITITSSESAASTSGTAAEGTSTTPVDIDIPDDREPAQQLADRLRSENGLVTDIEALSLDGKCITTDTKFRVSTKENVSEEELRSRLDISTLSDIIVEKESECSYLVRSSSLFPEGSIIQLKAADTKGDFVDSWAFQTAERFKIKSTYPADDVDGVYPDSGIEIEFTNPVDADTAADYFTITPALKGHFTTHRNTLYYIPDEDMLANTRYTVNVKAGLPSTESGVIEEDYSFSFITNSGSGSYFYIYNYNGSRSETYLESDPAVLEVSCSKELREKDFEIAIYRYATADSYSAAQQEFFTNGSVDTAKLEQVYRTLQQPTPNLVEWRPMFLLLPDDLDEGWYIADISVEGLKQQFFIQINPISVYALTLGEEKTFFVNDTNTGKAAVGADVKLTAGGKTYTAKAGSDGLAKLSTANSDDDWGTIDISYNGSRYIDLFYTSAENEVDYDSMYYMYLYTDREAYLTSDTISVWGVIRPRYDGVKVPDNISLCLGKSETEGEIKELDIASDGTFSTSFTYKNHAESYYVRLSMLDGNKNLMHQKSVQIRDYVKPTYVFDVELPEYAIMPHRNAVPMSITAQFYEGTPAKGLMFESSAESCTPNILKTDENGYVSAELLFSGKSTWNLCYTGHSVSMTGVENEYTYEWQSIPSFYRDVMLEEEYDKATHTLTLTTTSLDFTKIEDFLADYEHDYDILKGKPFDTKVTVNITHYWTERVESGSYYDYIEKRNVKQYDYIDHDEYIGTYSVNTKNGVGVLSDLPLTADKGYYSMDISYSDTLGQNVEEYYSVTNREDINYYRNPNYLYYSITSEVDENWDISFSENEQLTFTLECNDAPVTAKGGRVFFAVHQNDFITQTVYNATEFKYSPSISCIPNATFVGAYFDGKHVYPAYGSSIVFDPEERNIDITVTTDKDTYDAGETVQLTVKATDEQGRAVSGAAVQVSVVDEAAFAIAPQEVTFLDDVYHYVYYPYTISYYSYIQHVMDDTGMGEKGGGGDDFSVRKDFKDNAYFDAKTTGADGTARFTIKLADNLTTWRTTIHAMKETSTGRIYAGHRTHPIVATRPLFITPIMLNTYIEGDDIALTAKCQGLDKKDVITFRLTGEGIDKTLTAGSAKTVNFGKLPIGEYKVLFTAEKNGNKDAIELPLTVTDTILETDITNAFDLSEGIDITPTKWPVAITFFDKEYMFYTDILRELLCYHGDRTELQIASSFAATQFGWLTEEDFVADYSSITYDGFARELPAAEQNAELTALIAAAAPELINRAAVIPEFEYLLEYDNTEDICIGYMGLAALGEPVLEEVRAVLASGKVTDYYDRMRLVAALALSGDYNSAYDYYVQYTPNIAVIDSDPENVMAYIDCVNGEIQEQTKLALITAAILKAPEAEWFARYLISDDPMFDTYALELMIYLQNYVPKVEGDAVFTYDINGKTETVELDRHWGYTMRFGEEQFKNANFTVTSGAVYAVTNYIGRMEEQSKPATLSVSKTLSGDFIQGGLIKVTISAAPLSVVDDVIPSCGRYVDKIDNCYFRSGQRVSLFTNLSGTATYYFRITTEGEYVVEGALVQDGENWGISKRDTVTVKFEDEAV